MTQKLEVRNDVESEEKIYTSKSKEETLEYMVTHFKWKRSEITQDAFGSLVQKSSIGHFSKIDEGILKALKGEEATIYFEKGIGDQEIEHRLLTGFNTIQNKHPSFIQEVYANNKGLGYLKIYPLSENEDVVVAKRTSKKKLITRGIMMYRIRKYPNSVLIVPEQRAFTRREFEQVFEELQSLGVEMYKVYGDKFAVEDDQS
jgi:hypothetical protein